MDRLRQLVRDPQIGIDAWSDCYLAEATQLMCRLVDAGEAAACFQLLDELSREQRVRFFEAITGVEDPALAPRLLTILRDCEPELAESLVDGLRSWALTTEERAQLRLHAQRLRGRSPVLDKIIDSIA